jgi:Undecaprenyl-phosphate galactose phosphotransferase WbaP
MGQGKNWVVRILLMIFDAALIFDLFNLAAFIRNLLTPLLGAPLLWQGVLPIVQLGILFAILIFWVEGLYPGYGFTGVRELERLSRSVTLVFIFLIGASYFNKPFQDLSRAFLILSWLLTLVALPLGHFMLRNIISKFSWYGLPVVIFGERKDARQIASSLNNVRRLGWRPTEILPMSAIEQRTMDPNREVAIFVPPSGLLVDKFVHLLNQKFRKVVLVRQTENLGSVWVEPIDLDGQLGLEYHYHLLDGYGRWLKGLVDFGVGLVLSILLCPVIVILCLVVAIDSPGPIFFCQERLGIGFSRFKLIKFRTMTVDAEKRLTDFLQTNSVARAEYKKYHKLTNDPRLTRSGKWIRRFSLDELPQLLNVLNREMSVTGPRAYLPSELSEMGDYAPIILRIRPGLTGWWQVMGRHETLFEKRLKMDEYYISNWSLWMDFYIILKTGLVVLTGNGA